jgi:hypothetical protein
MGKTALKNHPSFGRDQDGQPLLLKVEGNKTPADF